MNNLAASIYMLSEGVPFLQAGEEMLRSKPNGDGTYDSNSYASGDEINSIKWSTLDDEQYMNVFEYYKGLIAFRKAHGALRLSDAADVAEHVQSVEGLDANVVAFDITGGINDETADEIYVIYNANEEETTVSLPDGDWNVYINGEKAGTEILETVKEGSVTVSPISAMVLVRESASAIAGSDGSASSSSASGKVAAGVVALVVVIAAAAGITVSKRKKKA
jgi:pullulanase